MPTRRKFTKEAGALPDALTIPSILSTKRKDTNIDFSKAKTDDELFALVFKNFKMTS